MTLEQYNLVYNAFSFTIAVMGAATIFFFLNRPQVSPGYRTAISLTGLVTLIACYHYVRIFNSWEAAFSVANGQVKATGLAFNDAYRYVDWLLTVPLLLIELILVMKLPRGQSAGRAAKLAVLAAVMVVLGYPGEIATDSTTRWTWWALSMIPFCIILFDLFFGLKSSINGQPAEARGLVNVARWVTVVSWCFYPVVFTLPMLGVANAQAAVQVGYTISDIVAKAGFGVLIYMIALKKSESEGFGTDAISQLNPISARTRSA
jgi:bacteriorhodopsin